MGMGYAGSMAIVVETDYVKNIAPKEYQALVDKLDEHTIDFDSFAYDYAYDDWVHIEEELDLTEDETELDAVIKLFVELVEALFARFKEETGLSLNINHHDSIVNGSRYDDVNGGFFDLPFHEVYTLTDKAAPHKDTFDMKFFVSYG